MHILDTARLSVRQLTPDDSPFILELVNDPSFLRFIGDRQVRNLEDARNYILNGPVASYTQFGFGLYHVSMTDSDAPIGMCGILKRPSLLDVDLGFALLPAFAGHGYAFEAANAVMNHEARVHGFLRVVAITDPDNARSIALLERLGMSFEKFMPRDPDETESGELKLFSIALAPVNAREASSRLT